RRRAGADRPPHSGKRHRGPLGAQRVGRGAESVHRAQRQSLLLKRRAGGTGTSMSVDPELSIVVPLFNEEDSVRPLYSAIVGAVAPLGLSFEILFVDDGSTDATVRL